MAKFQLELTIFNKLNNMKFNVIIGVLIIIFFSLIGFYFSGNLLKIIESLTDLRINYQNLNMIFSSKINMLLLVFFNSLVSFLYVNFTAKKKNYLTLTLGAFILTIVSGIVIILKLRLTYDYTINLNNIEYSVFTFLIMPILVNLIVLILVFFKK